MHLFLLFFDEFQIVLEDQAVNRSTILSKNQDVNSHLYCPHDFSSNTEFRDDLPTLLGNTKNTLNQLSESVLNKLKLNGPSIDVFHMSSRSEKRIDEAKGDQIKFFTPYERYLAVLPFAEQERLAESARIAEENRKRKLCPDSVTDVSKMIRNSEFITNVEFKLM